MNPSEAPLLPKLRGYIAEFLNKCSHERLWIFSSSTCVGLRYGSLLFSLEVFLAVWNRRLSSIRSTALRLSDNFLADLPTRNTLHASTVIAIGRPVYPTASPHRDNEHKGGPEY